VTAAPALRPAAVAGLFYPASDTTLRATVQHLLDAAPSAPTPRAPRAPRALIVPHAGYVYSGAAAAAAYRVLAAWPQHYTRAVVLGPPHRRAVRGIASVSVSAFDGPLGRVRIDRTALDDALARSAVVVDDAAHAEEHAIEVQLPFLQTLLGDFSLVPLLVGAQAAARTAELLAPWWDAPDTLIVVSTDLSHFLDYDGAQRLDAATDAMICALDARGLTPEHACGCHALGGLLHLARARRARIERVALCNSGDTAGPRDRVVGYGAYVLD
jgi:AmmeMemoRadiSam system protein B